MHAVSSRDGCQCQSSDQPAVTIRRMDQMLGSSIQAFRVLRVFHEQVQYKPLRQSGRAEVVPLLLKEANLHF